MTPDKWCPRCEEETERYASGDCAPCKREYMRAYNRRVKESPEQHRKRLLRKRRRYKTHDRAVHYERRYGITEDCYRTMLEEQGGVCAVCFASPSGRRLDVDHCHDTGEVRGLLCNRCNQALGLLQDDEDRLRRAIEYINKAGVTA